MTSITGITWDHTRGYLPCVATAQRYNEENPSVSISWSKRTLHDFGHMPISELAKRFDLLIIDHPFCGELAAGRFVHDLSELLSERELKELETCFVGRTYESWVYDKSLWALPVDGATPSSCFRPDLIGTNERPTTWDDLVDLAKSGRVAFAGFHADIFLTWMAISASLGSEICKSDEQLFDHDIASYAAELVRELVELVGYEWLDVNPIGVYESLSKSDRLSYSPIAYSYSAYSMPGFSRNRLAFEGLPVLPSGAQLRSVLGGTAVAISKRCQGENLSAALNYCLKMASAETQAGPFHYCGGQPAHKLAWQSEDLNSHAFEFYKNTRKTIEEAITRPRYSGYVGLQDKAGHELQQFVKGNTSLKETLSAVDRLYQSSQKGNDLT